jgi:hypothetical protein
MVDGRHAESARRRQRVITALDRAITEGAELGVSAIARAANPLLEAVLARLRALPTTP